MPSASVNTAIKVNAGVRRKSRKECVRSRNMIRITRDEVQFRSQLNALYLLNNPFAPLREAENQAGIALMLHIQWKFLKILRP